LQAAGFSPEAVPRAQAALQALDAAVVLHAPVEQAGAAPVRVVLSALAVPEWLPLADVERSALAQLAGSHSPGAGSHLPEAAWVHSLRVQEAA
jgi:hypothetical protein